MATSSLLRLIVPDPVLEPAASGLSRVGSWLRDWRALRRTMASVDGLTESQLRDIGLVRHDPAMARDAHRDIWRGRLGFGAARDP